MKKIVFISALFIFSMITALHAQRGYLFAENHSGAISMAGCDYFVTPVAARYPSCNPIAVTSLRRSVEFQDSETFTKSELMGALGGGYLYIGALVEATNGNLYVYSCNTRILYVKDRTGDCGGDLIEVEYDDYYTAETAHLEIFDMQ